MVHASSEQREIEQFHDRVDEVSRLIEGLKDGRLPLDYVDKRISEVQEKNQENAVQLHHEEQLSEQQAAKQQKILEKVEELKANRTRKEKARSKFHQYVQQKESIGTGSSTATDYHQWDLWCPSDEEDDLINSCTPNTPEFHALEKDIDDRHDRMLRQRQVAERQRVAGNKAFAQGQYTEAYRCYELGLDAQRHNMPLQANAAQAALRIGNWVTAKEHCDKVISLADCLHNKPDHPLVEKAHYRRALAHHHMGNLAAAAADARHALALNPHNAPATDLLRLLDVQLDEEKALSELGHAGTDPDNTPPGKVAAQGVKGSTCEHVRGAAPRAKAVAGSNHVGGEGGTQGLDESKTRVSRWLAAWQKYRDGEGRKGGLGADKTAPAGLGAGGLKPRAPPALSTIASDVVATFRAVAQQPILGSYASKCGLLADLMQVAAVGCHQAAGAANSPPAVAAHVITTAVLAVATCCKQSQVVTARVLRTLGSRPYSDLLSCLTLPPRCCPCTFELLELLHSATLHKHSRKDLVSVLLKRPPTHVDHEIDLEASVGCGRGEAGVRQGSVLLDYVLQFAMGEANDVDKRPRESALSLLGNLCVDPHVRLHVERHHASMLPGSLVAPLKAALGSKDHHTASQLCSIVTNLCQSQELRGLLVGAGLPTTIAPPLREYLAARQGATSVFESDVEAVVGANAAHLGARLKLATDCLTALCNLMADERAGEPVAGALPLSCVVEAAATCARLAAHDTRISDDSRSGGGLPVKQRKEGTVRPLGATWQGAFGHLEGGLLLQRLVAIAAKLGRHPAACGTLQQCHVDALVALVLGQVAALPAAIGNKGNQTSNTTLVTVGGDVMQLLDSSMNALAAMSRNAAAGRLLVKATGVERLVRDVSREYVSRPRAFQPKCGGNFALVLGLLVKEQRWREELCEGQALDALVWMVREDSAARQNAGITLARCFQEGPECRARLEELRAMEILMANAAKSARQG